MSTLTEKTIGLCLEPLDVLFFRDGRPFMTGMEHMVSRLPLPQTVAGAIRTALLRAAECDFPRLGKAMRDGTGFSQAVKQACGKEHHWIGDLALRGPCLARHGSGNEGIEVLAPVPSILQQEKHNPKKLLRLSPLPTGQLPGWNPPSDQQGLRPLWINHLPATEPVTGYLTPHGLEQFLSGDEVTAEDIVSKEDLFDIDYRTGIGISPERQVAAESQIFGRGFLSLKKDVFLYTEMVLSDDSCDGAVIDAIKAIPLGGEGRHVTLGRLQPFSWPEVSVREKQKPLILLTTPCAFRGGWKPHGLDDHILSASVPGSIPFSGWDLARGGPKPTRFAVPAGAVYFLDSLASLQPDSLAETDEDRQQGWGCFLKGVWTDE